MRHGSPLSAFHSGERRIDLDTPSSTFQRLNNLRPVLATIIAEFSGHLLWPHHGHFVCFLFPSPCKRDGQSTDALKISLLGGQLDGRTGLNIGRIRLKRHRTKPRGGRGRPNDSRDSGEWNSCSRRGMVRFFLPFPHSKQLQSQKKQLCFWGLQRTEDWKSSALVIRLRARQARAQHSDTSKSGGMCKFPQHMHLSGVGRQRRSCLR
jgi:hypothetical protein